MKAAGASAYLTKDVAPELLCSVISEALGQKLKGTRLFNRPHNSTEIPRQSRRIKTEHGLARRHGRLEV